MNCIRCAITLVLIFQLILGSGGLAWGQGAKPGKGSSAPPAPSGPPKGGRTAKAAGAERIGVESISTSEEMLPGGQALSKAVIPDQYVLGPGDGISINIWGEYDETYQMKVSPDGKISLPTIGDLTVKGLTLVQADSLIAMEVKKFYRNVRSGLSLTSLRVFEVLVLGAVQKPGTYLATPVRRVSDMVERAGYVLSGGSTRYVQVQRDGQVYATADLHRYLQKGDLGANPFVHDGDVIFVPPMSDRRITAYTSEVQVEAGGATIETSVPNTVELKPGERLSVVISEIGGIRPSWDLEGIFIERVSSSPEGTMRIPIDLRQHVQGQDIERQDPVMESGDKVYIPALANRVFVAGAVRLPAVYTYFPGKSADAYIAQAGGLSLTADLDRSFIKRADGTVSPYLGNMELNNGDTVVILEKMFKTYQDYFALVGSIAGVILSAVGLVAVFNLKK